MIAFSQACFSGGGQIPGSNMKRGLLQFKNKRQSESS